MPQSLSPRTNDRLRLHRVDADIERHSFAQGVRDGLSRTPKRLASCWLYDEIGSALFEAVTLLPEYYLTTTEAALLQRHGEEILACLQGPIEMIELGSGSARKTRILIETALRGQESLRYMPIDISVEALVASASALLGTYERVEVAAFAGDYRSAFASPPTFASNQALVLFLGSSIGNYAPEEALALLRQVRAGVRLGDALLLGVDFKKSRRELETAYDDPLGLTACFNRNVLARINRELGGTFPLQEFTFVARYDEARGCVDSFQEAKSALRVSIRDLEMEVDFSAGERIHTESSHKYDPGYLAVLAKETGFSVHRRWTDERERYGLFLLLAC